MWEWDSLGFGGRSILSSFCITEINPLSQKNSRQNFFPTGEYPFTLLVIFLNVERNFIVGYGPICLFLVLFHCNWESDYKVLPMHVFSGSTNVQLIHEQVELL